jgi:hypothetical protein
MRRRPIRIFLLTDLVLVGRGFYGQDVLRDTGVIVLNDFPTNNIK